MNEPGDVTELLKRIEAGDRDAVTQLTPLVYDDLKAIAKHHRARWHGDATMSVTVLVHDAYLRLVERTSAQWFSSKHFYAVASRAMRQMLVNYAQRRRALKRGGDLEPVTLEDRWMGDDDRIELILTVDTALDKLASFSDAQVRIVEARFFAGLSEAEIAESMGISDRTVRREWTKARAWLRSELEPAQVERLETDSN